MINTEDFMYLASNLTSAKYVFAKTMPKNPHWYTLRETWGNDADFVKSVELLRKYGYERRFFSKSYTSFNINGYYYWTMGEEINKDGEPWTILINKAARKIHAAYDNIADTYDTLFKDEEFLKENEEVMKMIGVKDGESVLDIGCGTGLFLDYANINKWNYLGIDPSSKMLASLHIKHPDYYTVNTDFESFYTTRKFDKAIALFGSPSYIKPDTLSRLKHFLKEDGKAILMFYKNEYSPVTYEKTHVSFNHYEFDKEKYRSVAEYKNYEIVEASHDEL